MYTVTIFRKFKEFSRNFNSLEEARNYAKMLWHLDPVITDSFGAFYT